MHSKSFVIALAATLASTTAQNIQGFNYGSTFTNGAAKQESDFQSEFTTAKNLVGTSGFTSARLYTTIQAGTANSFTSAIPAAIATKTTLLLGLWASAGQDAFNNELAALKSAINQYGTSFTSLVTGISVGSEDLYRISPIGIAAKSGVGASPSDIVSYINQLRQTIAGTPLSGASIGHVDTWTAWVNGTNDPVISAVDWLGMDAYPYFQNTEVNDIGVSKDVFFQAYYNTTGVSGGKPVWVTETGWPISGPTENLAVPSLQNAQTYWNQVGCSLFGKVNTYWYTLQDAAPDTPSPSFGIVGSTLGTTPAYDLSCKAVVSSSSSSSSAASTPSTTPSATSSIASSVGVTAIASGLPASSAGSGPIVGSAASSAATFEASTGAAATGNTSPTPGTASVTTYPIATSLSVTPASSSEAPASTSSVDFSTLPGIVATNSTTYTIFPVTTVTGPVGPSTITLAPTAAPTAASSSFGTGFVPSTTASASSSPIVSSFPGSAPSVTVGGFTAAMAAVFAFFVAL